MKLPIVILLFALGLMVSRAGEGITPPMLSSLKEAVFLRLISDAPPRDLFTVAMEFDPSEKIFVAPSDDFVKRMLKIEGVRKDLWVTRGALVIPASRERIADADGTFHYPAVTKRGTTRTVDVYRVDSAVGQPADEVEVSWSRSCGPLSGNGGKALFRRVKDDWIFVEHLELYAF